MRTIPDRLRKYVCSLCRTSYFACIDELEVFPEEFVCAYNECKGKAIMMDEEPADILKKQLLSYNREVLLETLIYHQRRDHKGCICGWSELGKSHPEHIIHIYEEAVTGEIIMAERSVTYVCPECKATKTLVAQSYESTREFLEDLPDSIPCGWRGCDEDAVR